MGALHIVIWRATACAGLAAALLFIGNPFLEGRRRLIAMCAFAAIAVVLFCVEPLA